MLSPEDGDNRQAPAGSKPHRLGYPPAGLAQAHRSDSQGQLQLPAPAASKTLCGSRRSQRRSPLPQEPHRAAPTGLLSLSYSHRATPTGLLSQSYSHRATLTELLPQGYSPMEWPCGGAGVLSAGACLNSLGTIPWLLSTLGNRRRRTERSPGVHLQTRPAAERPRWRVRCAPHTLPPNSTSPEPAAYAPQEGCDASRRPLRQWDRHSVAGPSPKWRTRRPQRRSLETSPQHMMRRSESPRRPTGALLHTPTTSDPTPRRRCTGSRSRRAEASATGALHPQGSQGGYAASLPSFTLKGVTPAARTPLALRLGRRSPFTRPPGRRICRPTRTLRPAWQNSRLTIGRFGLAGHLDALTTVTAGSSASATVTGDSDG